MAHNSEVPPYQEQIQRFAEHLRRRQRSPATVDGYQRDIRLFMDWLQLSRGQNVVVEDIRGTDILQYREHLEVEREARPTTVKRKMEAVRQMCRWAARQNLLPADVVTDIGPVQAPPVKAPDILTPREVQALLRTAGQSPQGFGARNYALVQVFLQTGLSVTEVSRLLVADLKLNSRYGVVRVRPGPGCRPRDVTLNQSVRRALSRYLDQREDPSPKDAVFLTQENKPMAVRSIQNVIATLAWRAAIKRVQVSPRTLRHTFADNYLRSHPDQFDMLGLALGYQSEATAAMYARSPERKGGND